MKYFILFVFLMTAACSKKEQYMANDLYPVNALYGESYYIDFCRANGVAREACDALYFPFFKDKLREYYGFIGEAPFAVCSQPNEPCHDTLHLEDLAREYVR